LAALGDLPRSVEHVAAGHDHADQQRLALVEPVFGHLAFHSLADVDHRHMLWQ
jgi:hypothetical protein